MTTPAGTGLRCCILARVSTIKQHEQNQLDVLRKWMADRGVTIVSEYVVEDSAWETNGSKGKEFEAAREAIINEGRLGQWDILTVWAIDRLGRRGIEDTLATMRRLYDQGRDIWSHQEQWLITTEPRMRELLVSFMAWMAEQESSRRSERVKAGIARTQLEIAEQIAAGKTPTKRIGGRKLGSKDRKPRRTEGYRKPKGPPPEWMAQAQAMYDEIDADGRPAHSFQSIADQCGSNINTVWRRLSKNGPGGKARAQGLTPLRHLPPRPPAPTPEWVAAAQAMYDEVGEVGEPVHPVLGIAERAGVSSATLYRHLDRGGPGGKAREDYRRKQAASSRLTSGNR
jgi:putative DNA-invertase from lambdoid prophage Rac